MRFVVYGYSIQRTHWPWELGLNFKSIYSHTIKEIIVIRSVWLANRIEIIWWVEQMNKFDKNNTLQFSGAQIIRFSTDKPRNFMIVLCVIYDDDLISIAKLFLSDLDKKWNEASHQITSVQITFAWTNHLEVLNECLFFAARQTQVISIAEWISPEVYGGESFYWYTSPISIVEWAFHLLEG